MKNELDSNIINSTKGNPVKKILAFASILAVLALVACDDSTNNVSGDSSTVQASSGVGASSQSGNSSSSAAIVSDGKLHACASYVSGVVQSCVYTADTVVTKASCEASADSLGAGGTVSALTVCPTGSGLDCGGVDDTGASFHMYFYSADMIAQGQLFCAILQMSDSTALLQ